VGLRGQLSHPENPGRPSDTSRDVADGEHQNHHPCQTERQKQTRLTVSKIDELLATREAGATIAELAAQFNIHRTTVMAHLKRKQPAPQHISMRPR